MAEQLANLDKRLPIKTDTFSGTTTSNGNITQSRIPISKPIISAWTTDSDNTSGAYAVIPMAPRSASGTLYWRFNVRKGISSLAVVAETAVTIHVAYIDEDIL